MLLTSQIKKFPLNSRQKFQGQILEALFPEKEFT